MITPPTVFITGVTSGLGRALGTEFAIRHWHIAAHGRDDTRLAAVAEELKYHGATVTTLTADLTEPTQVRNLCERLRAEFPTLDLVVNNAALGSGADPTRRETNSHGTELRMVANYLAPFVINRELADLVARSPHGRIVNVASMGQEPLVVDDFGFERGYDGIEAYCRSKLALIMDTIDLGAELEPTGVTVNAVHPAHLMPTNMVREMGFEPAATIDDGLLPVLRAALDPALSTTTGHYFDRFTPAHPHEQADDQQVRHLLATWAREQLPPDSAAITR